MDNLIENRTELFDRSIIESFPKFNPSGEHKKLFEAMRKDNLIIFFGAGVSLLAGCAGWDKMAYNLVDTFPNSICSELEKNILKRIAISDQMKVISICFQMAKGDENLLKDVYYQSIINSVKPESPELFSYIHNKILDLKAISYVTTNIDKGLNSASSEKRRGRQIYDMTNDPEAAKSVNEIRNGNIFYLHGTIDHMDKAILTLDNYCCHYNKKETIWFLRNIFSNDSTVLFIGYSLSDYEILQNIFSATKNEDYQNKEAPKHFLLSPIFSKDLAEFNIMKSYFNILSIESIPYFIDYDGYSRLDYVLDLLKKIHIEYQPDTLNIYDAIEKV